MRPERHVDEFLWSDQRPRQEYFMRLDQYLG